MEYLAGWLVVVGGGDVCRYPIAGALSVCMGMASFGSVKVLGTTPLRTL
jgi:hypothetical protein